MAIIPEFTEMLRELKDLMLGAKETTAALREEQGQLGAGGGGLSSAGQSIQNNAQATANLTGGGVRIPRATASADAEDEVETPRKSSTFRLRGLRKISRAFRAAYGIFELVNAAGAIEALTNTKQEESFQRQLQDLDDKTKVDPRTGLVNQPFFQKMQLQANHFSEQSRQAVAIAESLFYFAGPLGRVAGFIGGRISNYLLDRSDLNLKNTVDRAEAEDIFRKENLVPTKGPRKATRSQDADTFIDQGGDVELLKSALSLADSHNQAGLKAAEMGDTVRAQKEYDLANGIYSRTKVYKADSPSNESPVNQYQRMDRAKAAMKMFTQSQQMQPNFRTGE